MCVLTVAELQAQGEVSIGSFPITLHPPLPTVTIPQVCTDILEGGNYPPNVCGCVGVCVGVCILIYMHKCACIISHNHALTGF